MKDLKLSDIKKICSKQKACETCPFCLTKSVMGVCMFSPIGTTPASWNIDEEETVKDE